MLLANLLDQMIDRGQERKHSDVPGVHSIESLRLLLQEERERSNRSRIEFSFVRFDLQPLARNDAAVSRFIRVIMDRVRAIDKVGLMAGKSLGVILPSTSSEGAHALADDILRLQDRPELMIEYTVYTYPFNMYEE
jgi:GGDEF domain-containing protein